MTDQEICDVCEVAMVNEDCECNDCHNHTISTYGPVDGCTRVGTRGVLVYALSKELDFVDVGTYETEADALKVVNDIDSDERVYFVCMIVDGDMKTFTIRE